MQQSFTPTTAHAPNSYFDFRQMLRCDVTSLPDLIAYAEEHALVEAMNNASMLWVQPAAHVFIFPVPDDIRERVRSFFRLNPLVDLVVEHQELTGETLAYAGRFIGQAEGELPFVYVLAVVASDKGALGRFMAKAQTVLPELVM